MVFYTIFILLLFGSYKHINSKYYDKIFLTITILLFIIIGGLRDNVGSDWPAYYREFISIVYSDSFSWNSVIRDPLFYFFEYLISRIAVYPHIFFLIIFTLSFLLKYNFIKRYAQCNIYFALLIYLSGIFLIFDINGIRQGLALGVVLFSTKFIFENKLYHFLICIFCSAFIHSSSIVFLLAYPIYNIKCSFSAKQYIALTIIAIGLGIITSQYLEVIIKYLNTYQEGVEEHYEYYAEGIGGYTNKVSIWGIASIRRYVIWAIILYSLKDIQTREVKFYKNCIVVSFFLFFLFNNSMEMSYRVAYYYSVFEMLLIPIVISSIKKQHVKFIVFVLLSLIYFYLTFKLVDNPQGKLNVYHNIIFSI